MASIPDALWDMIVQIIYCKQVGAAYWHTFFCKQPLNNACVTPSHVLFSSTQTTDPNASHTFKSQNQHKSDFRSQFYAIVVHEC